MGLTADPRARGNSIVGDLVRGFFRHGIDVKEEAGSAIGYEQGLKHYCLKYCITLLITFPKMYL